MPKYLMYKERLHMEVKPVKWLFNSSLIHGVIMEGRKFIVDLNNGDLTVYNPKHLIEEQPEKINFKVEVLFPKKQKRKKNA